MSRTEMCRGVVSRDLTCTKPSRVGQGNKKILREIIPKIFLNQMKIKLTDPRSSMNPKHKKHEVNFKLPKTDDKETGKMGKM